MLIRRGLIFTIVFFTSFINCISQDIDSTEKAIEIFKKDKDKTYVVKIGQRVQVPCRHIKNGLKKMVTTELVAIEGKKMYFEPLNKNYHEAIYTLSTIDKIGIRTPFRLLESTFWITYNLIYYNYHYFIDSEIRGSFKTISFRSRKWKIRIVELNES
ncbi:MAG: hypothetical protein WCX31_15155 [Salinivirgaceae bacterium]